MAQAAGYTFNTDTVSGSTVRDLAGYFLDGTIVGSASTTPGKSGYGHALSCTGGAMQVPVAADTYPVNTDGGLTVAAWVRLTDNTAAARCIASGKSGSSLDWALYASNASGNVEAVIEGTAYSTSTSIRDDTWHHVMVVVDRIFGPGSESLRIILDGTLVLSSSSLTTNLAYSGSVTVEVGRNALSGAQALNGLVDDFRWWNDPVSSASWAAIRDAEQTDLQYAIYPFDDGTGDDFSVYNRDLTLAGSASFAAGMYGNALSSTAAAAGGSATVDFGNLDRLAITGWLRLDTAPVGSAAPILAIADTGGSNKCRAVVNTDRTITVTWVTIYGTFSVTSTSALTVGAWTRFHLNMNPTYVGIRLGSNTQTTTSTGNGDPHLTPTVNDLKTLYVGGDASAGGQVSFDYLMFTRNFIDVPANNYWAGPRIVATTRPANVARGVYEFNENAGTTADDKSTFNNDLTLTAAGSWITGVQGSALGSNGTGPGAGKSSGLAWSASPLGWAFSGWFRCRSGSSGARILVLRNGSSEVAHAFYLSGAFQVRLYDATGNTGLLSPNGSAVTAETWTHLAASCNGSTIQFWINGKRYGSVDYTRGALLSPTQLYVGGDDPDGSVADVDSLTLFDTPLSLSDVAWLYANPGAFSIPPQNVTLATASETDTAYPLVNSKTVTLGTASETDTAYGLAASKDVGLATASETDTAYPVTAAKDVTLATAPETDTAYALVPVKAATLATAAEIDAAYALAAAKTVTLATASETDTAYPVIVENAGAARVLATANETDAAYPVTATKTFTLGTAHEIDRAFALAIAGGEAMWPVLTVSNSPSSQLEVSHGI